MRERGAALARASYYGLYWHLDRHAHAGVALRLPVQGLVLAVLLEKQAGQQVRAGKSPRQHVEWRGRLGDRFAGPAGEVLPDVLQHLPRARHHLQPLGDVLTELGQPGRAAAGAGARTGHEGPLAQQVRGKRTAGPGTAAWVTWNGPLGLTRLLSREVVLGDARFQLLQFELHLVEQARAALRALAVEFAPHLLDREPQMNDHCLGADLPRLGPVDLGLRGRQFHLAHQQEPLEGGDVVGQRGAGQDHGGHQSRFARLRGEPTCGQARPESPRRSGTPGPLRMAPVDPLQEIAELGRRDRHRTLGGRRPFVGDPIGRTFFRSPMPINPAT